MSHSDRAHSRTQSPSYARLATRGSGEIQNRKHKNLLPLNNAWSNQWNHITKKNMEENTESISFFANSCIAVKIPSFLVFAQTDTLFDLY